MPAESVMINSNDHLRGLSYLEHKILDASRWPVRRYLYPPSSLPPSSLTLSMPTTLPSPTTAAIPTLPMASPTTATLSPTHGSVVDIGGSAMNHDMGTRLASIIQAPYGAAPGEKPTLPDECLYDDIGLPIWNKIIQTPEFYQTHDEVALFDLNGAEIVDETEPGTTLIDLGAGDTGKVQHLLEAFEKANKPVTYLALDISKASLDLNIAFLQSKHPVGKSNVTCAGLWGDFHKGKEYAQRIKGPRLFLSLGSVLCNDEWSRALNHLKFWAELVRPEDRLLVGMDGHMLPKDHDKLWNAYHSREDLYRQFFLNGFHHVNKLLKGPVFREADWHFKAEMEELPTTRHRFFFVAKQDITSPKIARVIKKGEEWDWFDSHKYSQNDVMVMCQRAGLHVAQTFHAPASEFRQYLIKAKPHGQSDRDSAVSGISA